MLGENTSKIPKSGLLGENSEQRKCIKRLEEQGNDRKGNNLNRLRD